MRSAHGHLEKFDHLEQRLASIVPTPDDLVGFDLALCGMLAETMALEKALAADREISEEVRIRAARIVRIVGDMAPLARGGGA